MEKEIIHTGEYIKVLRIGNTFQTFNNAPIGVLSFKMTSQLIDELQRSVDYIRRENDRIRKT